MGLGQRVGLGGVVGGGGRRGEGGGVIGGLSHAGVSKQLTRGHSQPLPRQGFESEYLRSDGTRLPVLIVEAPLSPEMKAGFAHFGFSEDEAEDDPFLGVKRIR